jgi:flagellar biosynthesis repressor protein FlbT
MPLTINLKPGEKIIVNGAVIQNADHSARLIFHNEASLLRQKDIIPEESANTPARRVYFAVQCQYLFPDKADIHLPLIHRFLQEFVQAAPSTYDLVKKIAEEVDAGQLYQALKSARQLLAREQEILNAVTGQGIRADADSRQSGAQ